MNGRLSPEEARDAAIAERTAKNAEYTKALIAAGDPTAIHIVGDCVTDYLASAYDDLHKLVIGETTFEQVRDKVIEIEAETQAIKQVERMEKDREEQARQAHIERMAWNREIGYLI